MRSTDPFTVEEDHFDTSQPVIAHLSSERGWPPVAIAGARSMYDSDVGGAELRAQIQV